MENLKSQIILFAIFVLVLVFHPLPVSRQETEDEREFTCVEGSKNGPEKWGEIHPEWAACNHGKMQSPIDLLDKRVTVGTHLKQLKRNYQPTNTTIKNRGHDIMLRWVGGEGSIQIDNTEYVFQRCHWHAPSEHTINGNRIALKLHMVHESADKKIAVVGVTYILGQRDPFLSEVHAFMKEEEEVVGVLDPGQIKMGCRKYYIGENSFKRTGQLAKGCS